MGVLTLPLEGTESVLTYWKSGTFATEALLWPESVDAVKRQMPFPAAPSVMPHCPDNRPIITQYTAGRTAACSVYRSKEHVS